MIHSVDPRQNRLFDPFEGVIPPAGRKIIANGWQGVFRHVILEVMPVGELAQHFSDSLGAPTKELYSMAGLVFLADFFGWNAQEAIEAYIFRSDVQYAFNLEPGADVSARAPSNAINNSSATTTSPHGSSTTVTTQLIEALDLDVSRQRLDSTHVFSHMASFGRTKLMAVAIKRFLTQLQRHDHDAYAALPEDFRRRYAPAQARLFADAKDAEARARYRQQAAEDLHFIITRFADRPDHTSRSTYKALVTIFDQQCELSGEKVVVKAKTGGDCVQNPSDLDATYERPQRARLPGAARRDLRAEQRGATDHRRAAADRVRAGRGGGRADARPTGASRAAARGDAGRHALHRRRERPGRRGAGRGPDRPGPRPRARGRPRGADGRRLRVGRAHRHDRRLPRGPRADVVFARRGDGDDADRDAGVGLRRVPVSEAMSDREYT